jgi:hypothetical protein
MKYFQKYFYLLAGLLSFIVYLVTLAPGVIQIDSGELAAVQYTLGIAHPTGYPLFTIIGYLFSQIPLPLTKIFQLNILAAIYCSIAVSIFSYTAKLVLLNYKSLNFIKIEKGGRKKRKSSDKTLENNPDNISILSEDSKSFIALLSGLFLAFSKTFWFQSTSVEVYSLHLLLINLIILLLFRAYLLADKNSNVAKGWIIFSIALALGFTNHMTTLLVLPAVAYFYFDKNKFNLNSFKQLLLMIIVFLVFIVLVYSYLPLRASQNPVLNWGNPIDLERILRHIAGKQYQVWLFSSSEAAAKQLNYFISNLPKEFFISLLLCALGLIFTFNKTRKFFIFNMILFLSTVFYSINYDINDIDAYFLPSYISISFFVFFGIVQLILFFRDKNLKVEYSFIIVLSILVIQSIPNYSRVDQSDNYAYEDYTKSLLNSVPQNSIVFSYQWDYFISASYYYQMVEKFRDDVVIIDKELLRRSWYYNQLDRNHNTLLAGIKPEVNQFLEALKPFERGQNFNSNLLENLFRKIMTGLISTKISDHNYFVAPEVVEGEMSRGEFQLPKGYSLVPHLFLFKVVNSDEYVKAPLPDFKIRFSNNKDKYSEFLQNIIGGMLVRRALYEIKFGFNERAKIYTKKIAAEFPNITLPPELNNLINN